MRSRHHFFGSLCYNQRIEEHVILPVLAVLWWGLDWRYWTASKNCGVLLFLLSKMWITHIQVAEVTFSYISELISFCFYLQYINIFFQKCLYTFQVKFSEIRIRAWKLLFKWVVKKYMTRIINCFFKWGKLLEKFRLLKKTQQQQQQKTSTEPLSSIWLWVALPPGGLDWKTCFKTDFQGKKSKLDPAA